MCICGANINMEKPNITSNPTDANHEETIHRLISLFTFLDSETTPDGDCSHQIKKTLALWKKNYDQPRQHVKKQ